MGGGGLGRTDWLTTLLRWLWLAGNTYERLSGCHVRLRQASSAALEVESLRADHPEVDAVGDEIRLPFAGEYGPVFEVLIALGPYMGRMAPGP
jgi:hypothetical protein